MNRVQAWDSWTRMYKYIYLALSVLVCVCVCTGSCVWLLPLLSDSAFNFREQKQGRRFSLFYLFFSQLCFSSSSSFSFSSSSSLSSSSSSPRQQASVNTLAGRNPPRLHTLSHRLFKFVEPSRRKIPLGGSLTDSESNLHFPPGLVSMG